MPIVGIDELAGDARRHRCRNGFEDEREASRGLERPRVTEQRDSLLRRPPLRLEPAEHRRRLWCQADVPHHRDPGVDDRTDACEHRARSLELHGVRSGLLDEADRVANRILVRDLERAEGHVGDHERPARPACDSSGEDEHLVHRGRHGRFVSEDGHRGRVADEHEVHAGFVGEAPSGRVVRRDHHDRLVSRLHLGELGDRELSRRRSGGRGLLRADAHRSSPSRTALSMSRVEPTRTAPARTGGSKSATST